MKKLIIILLSFCLLEACSTEEELFLFTFSYQNNADQSCDIRSYGNGELLHQITITPSKAARNCEYQAPSYLGACYDSIVFEFPNGKGYSCYAKPNEYNDELCFSEQRDPIINLNGFTSDNKIDYQFSITEEDYLNAKDLD